MVCVKKRVALVTGILGQDGSYLAELLLARGYEVHGIDRPEMMGQPGAWWRVAEIREQITVHGDMLEDYDAVRAIVKKVSPTECYHLAGVSVNSYLFEDEFRTIGPNLSAVHYLLGALKSEAAGCRFFFAGSAELFGRATHGPQDEGTAFHPRSAYGIYKEAGFELTRYYREQHGMYTCTGILYNHESPRRGKDFVTKKITATVAAIKRGEATELRLGNVEARRDWGHAQDYVEAMWLMLQQEKGEDFVIASGEQHSVREFAEAACGSVGLKLDDVLVVDPALFRPVGVEVLYGNPQRAQEKLGWRRRYKFEEIVREMVGAEG